MSDCVLLRDGAYFCVTFHLGKKAHELFTFDGFIIALNSSQLLELFLLLNVFLTVGIVDYFNIGTYIFFES